MVDGKPYVNHIDGNKLNNNVDNLEWCTAKENSRHSWDLGLQKSVKGEDTYHSVLTDDMVRYILSRYKPYCRVNGNRAIAREIGVAHSTVSKVTRGITWTHAQPNNRSVA